MLPNLNLMDPGPKTSRGEMRPTAGMETNAKSETGWPGKVATKGGILDQVAHQEWDVCEEGIINSSLYDRCRRPSHRPISGYLGAGFGLEGLERRWWVPGPGVFDRCRGMNDAG